MSKSQVHRGPVKVFVADSSQLSCQLIAAELRRARHRAKVVGYATDSNGIREGIGKSEPEIAVIGARLEEGAVTGFEVTREIRADYPNLGIVMILDSSKPATVVQAFRSGATGVFSRDQSSKLLSKCVNSVSQGRVWATCQELNYLIAAMGAPVPAKSASLKASGLLTKREEGVVHLVAEGLTNRDISHQLNLSENTVRNYLFRIFNKVGTSNRLELALYAIDRREVAGQQESLRHVI